jgi:hypothetical protein
LACAISFSAYSWATSSAGQPEALIPNPGPPEIENFLEEILIYIPPMCCFITSIIAILFSDNWNGIKTFHPFSSIKIWVEAVGIRTQPVKPNSSH